MTNLEKIIIDANKAWNEIKTAFGNKENYEIEIDTEKMQPLFQFLESTISNPFCRVSRFNETMYGAFCGMIEFEYIEPYVRDMIIERIKSLKEAIHDLGDAELKNQILYNLEYKNE